MTGNPSRNLFSFPQRSPTFPKSPQTKKTICRPKNHQKKSWQEILGKTQTNATEFQCMRFPNFPQRSPNQNPAWDLLAICLGFAWDLLGICLGFAWDVLGICVGFAWDLLGICLGHAWDCGNFAGCSLGFADLGVAGLEAPRARHQ